MECPNCHKPMQFCPTDGGYVCIPCDISVNEVWQEEVKNDKEE